MGLFNEAINQYTNEKIQENVTSENNARNKKKYGDSLRAEAVKNKILKAIGDITKDRNLRVLMEPEIEDIIDEERV